MATQETTSARKTWERTKTPGLLRHRTGRYYARFTLAGKTRFIPLRTDLAEVARVRFAEEKVKVERTRKAARKTAGGVASMGDLATLARERIDGRTVSEHTKDLNRYAVAFLEKTWDGFAKLRPAEVTADAVAKWRDHALTVGTGYRPPGAKTEAPAREKRGAQHQQDVSDDRAGDRGFDHADQSPRQGEQRDDQFGRVAKRRVEQPPTPCPTRAPSASVARPIHLASGMIASPLTTKSQVGLLQPGT